MKSAKEMWNNMFKNTDMSKSEIKEEEPNIKKLIEKYKEIEIEEETNEKVD